METSGRSRRRKNRVAPRTVVPEKGGTALAVLLMALVVAGLWILGAPAHTAAQDARDAAAQEEDPYLERARALHQEAVLIDGHNDLPWQIREGLDLRLHEVDLREPQPQWHTDIPRLREGGVGAKFWAAYVPARYLGDHSTAVALEQIDVIKRMADAYPDHFEMAYTADDVERIFAEGRIASLIGIEGGHAISNSLPVLRQLYEAGARYMTLTHSETLAWADAAGDTAVHNGLTDFGEKVVREMNRLGMLVDLSHVTDDVMHDALDVTRAPVIFSHSSARALADHPRNVPDDVLERLPENGGVVMTVFYSAFVDPDAAEAMEDLFAVQRELREEYPDPDDYRRELDRWREENPIPRGTVSTVADHVDHMVEVAGIEHVGLGSDYDGVTVLPEGLEDVSTFPNLTAELLRRGYTDEEVKKILGGNVLRVMREVEEVARELRATEPEPFDRLPFFGIEPERADAR